MAVCVVQVSSAKNSIWFIAVKSSAMFSPQNQLKIGHIGYGGKLIKATAAEKTEDNAS